MTICQKCLEFIGALRLGSENFPAPLGMFGLSTELIANLYHGKREQYKTLGAKPFNTLINKRINFIINKSPSNRDKMRALRKYIREDFELLLDIRNFISSHSLTHKINERQKLTKELRDWLIRYGFKKQFANKTFSASNLRRDLMVESFGLYKLALRLNRIANTNETKAPIARINP